MLNGLKLRGAGNRVAKGTVCSISFTTDMVGIQLKACEDSYP